MVEHKHISLDLSEHQIRKLSNGHKVNVSHDKIGHGMKLRLPAHHIKKLHEAKKHFKGMKLELTKEEGRGLKDFLKGAWSGYQKFVKPVVAPVIRKGLVNAIKAGAPAAAIALGAPEAAPAASWVADQLASPLVNSVGNATGAYGLHRRPKHHHHNREMHHGKYQVYDLPNLPDFSQPDYLFSGGKFRLHTHGHRIHHPHQVKRLHLHGGSFLPA